MTSLHVAKYVGDVSKGYLPNYASRSSDIQELRATVEVREKRSFVLCCHLKQSLGKVCTVRVLLHDERKKRWSIAKVWSCLYLVRNCEVWQ